MASAGVQAQAPAASRGFLATDSPLRTVLLALVLMALVIALYAPAHSHPFFDLDDPNYVINNPHIQNGLTPGTVFWAFTHGYSANWHPLTWLSHALDLQLFGTDPSFHHDENVLFHALDAALLFWVLKRATGYTGRSFMVAALFAVHPLNVESVAWIAERKTMLSTLFFLLALGAYRWYAARPGVGRYLAVAGLFALGLMCKPQIIMLPLVLLLWDYWPLGRMITTPGQPPSEGVPAKSLAWLVKEKIPLFFICLVDAALTVIAQHAAGSAQPFTLWIRIENAIVSYGRYIGKAFWPTKLALYYPHPGATLAWWQTGGAFLLLLMITVLSLRARRHKYLIVGWLWFLIMLIPMIGLLQVDVQGMADRYSYVSFIGLFLMLCWGLPDLVAEWQLPKMLLPTVSVAALLALSLVTYRQLGYWSSNVAIWRHSVEVTSGNWKAESMLGLAMDVEGDHDQAQPHYWRAAAINPTDPLTNLNIAIYAHNHGNLPMAIEYYKKTLANAYIPEHRAQALTNLVKAYREMGDDANAERYLQKLNAPRQGMNWQGAWWEQILPEIREFFHGDAKPQN